MNRKLLIAALAATLLLCAGLALHDGDEVVAARPLRPARNDGVAATTDAAKGQPAAKAAPVAASRRDTWPDATAAAVVAWAGSAPATSGPTSAAAPAAAAERRALAAIVSAAPPAPPPAPRAPAFGFELIGTVVEGQTHGALIQSPQRSLWVRVGDTVDGAWRVQQVHADSVDLIWLPQQLPAALRYRAP